MGKIRSRIGPHSRRLTLGQLDLRTAEGRYAKAIRDALVEFVGPQQLTPTLQLLISATAIKALRLEMLAQRVLSGSSLDGGQDARFLGWANSLRHDLEAIGLRGVPEAPGAALDRFIASLPRQNAA